MFTKYIYPLLVFFCCYFSIGCNGISETEINSYTLLTRSLDNSNKNIAWATERTQMYIEEEALTYLQYKPIATKARETDKLTKDYFDFIDSLKKEIWNLSTGILSDKKAPKTVLIKNKKALLLKTKTIQLKQNYLDSIAALWDNNGIKESIFCEIKRKESNLKKLNANIALDSCINDWENQTFQGLSTAAVLALLTQMQNDAQLSEAIVINFLAGQFGRRGGKCFEQYDILSSPTKTTIHLGETYETTIHFGMQPSSLGYDLFINNEPIHNQNYTTIPQSIGKKEFLVQFKRYSPWTGEKETITKKFEYNVIK